MRGFSTGAEILKCAVLWAALVTNLVACSPQNISTNSGLADPAILGGRDVAPGEALAQSVVILFNRANSATCTASLLNNQFVLTAAHCVTGADSKDLYLIFDIKMQKTSPYRHVVAFKEAPHYSLQATRPKNRYDLAVVRFAGGVPAGFSGAKFLPNSSLLKDAADVTVAGYGVTDNTTRVGTGTLRTANLKILKADFSETEVSLNQTANVGACHGDSGGPVYLYTEGRYFLWGVISRSLTDDCSAGAVVTNALLYLEWLKSTVLSMGRQKMVVPPEDGPLFNDDVF
jgi:secreted trypsin-like serine protease